MNIEAKRAYQRAVKERYNKSTNTQGIGNPKVIDAERTKVRYSFYNVKISLNNYSISCLMLIQLCKVELPT